jgi:hypothetical protein
MRPDIAVLTNTDLVDIMMFARIKYFINMSLPESTMRLFTSAAADRRTI